MKITIADSRLASSFSRTALRRTFLGDRTGQCVQYEAGKMQATATGFFARTTDGPMHRWSVGLSKKKLYIAHEFYLNFLYYLVIL